MSGAPDNAPEFPEGGGMMVTVSFVRISPAGDGRVLTRRMPLRLGGGPELERLRLASVGHLLVSAMEDVLATSGWKPDSSPRRGPPVGPERPLEFKSVPNPGAPWKRWITPGGMFALAREGDQLEGWREWTPADGPWPGDEGDPTSGEGSPL